MGAAPFLPLLLAGAACFFRGAFLLSKIESSESDGSDDSSEDWVLAADLRPFDVLEDGPAFEEGRTGVLGVAVDTLGGRSNS